MESFAAILHLYFLKISQKFEHQLHLFVELVDSSLIVIGQWKLIVSCF